MGTACSDWSILHGWIVSARLTTWIDMRPFRFFVCLFEVIVLVEQYRCPYFSVCMMPSIATYAEELKKTVQATTIRLR